ncbi:MAG: arylsulfotransferase family protein [Desulfohalobiaceae bacterium]
MKYFSIFSGSFLLLISFFAWGYIAAEYEYFPGETIKSIQEEVTAFLLEQGPSQKSIMDKLSHDIGMHPKRLLEDQKESPDRDYKKLKLDGLKDRRSLPLIYTTDKEEIPAGYLLIWGAFDFERGMHAAILINSQGEVIHKWIPDTEAFQEAAVAYNKEASSEEDKVQIQDSDDLPQGISVFPDGSFIYNDGDPGNGMQKLDFCSRPQWTKLGQFSHTISKQKSDSSIWTIDQDKILHQIDPEQGKSLRRIKVLDIMKANQDADILSLRFDDLNDKWLDDRWHINDIQPLPAEYEEEFPGFHTGDLLLSLRSLNAVLIMDQESLDIKWWRIGPYSRQHDPDWQEKGTITVYDNQTRYKISNNQNKDQFSRILELAPNGYEVDVLYAGEQDNFYSSVRGKHQILPDGRMLITSSQQGRVMMVNQKGETVLEVINKYSNEEALLVSEAVWLPEGFFDFDPQKSKCNNYDE